MYSNDSFGPPVVPQMLGHYRRASLGAPLGFPQASFFSFLFFWGGEGAPRFSEGIEAFVWLLCGLLRTQDPA